MVFPLLELLRLRPRTTVFARRGLVRSLHGFRRRVDAVGGRIRRRRDIDVLGVAVRRVRRVLGIRRGLGPRCRSAGRRCCGEGDGCRVERGSAVNESGRGPQDARQHLCLLLVVERESLQ